MAADPLSNLSTEIGLNIFKIFLLFYLLSTQYHNAYYFICILLYMASIYT